MMKKKISTRDWQTLSAYLDEQLSNRERARIETRLDKNPELGKTLEEIRNIRTLLRQLPAKRAPRNFTLTPQMVGMRSSPPRTFPTLRFASVLSTVLLVLVWFSNLLFPMGMETLPRMVAISEAPEAPLELAEPPFDSAGEILDKGLTEEPTLEVSSGILGIPGEESVEAEDREPDLEVMALPDPIPTQPAEAESEPEEADLSGELAPGETESEQSRLAIESPDDADSEINALAIHESMLSRLSQWGVQDYVMAFLAFVAVTTGLAAIYVRRKGNRWS
jgi:hypothetical protein